MLWAYRTTKRFSIGITPFSLAYGIEVIISIDIITPTLRVEGVDQVLNDAQLMSLDQSEK